MKTHSENQRWLGECGTVVIQKKLRDGIGQLNEWEHLLYNVWYTDFMLKTVGRIDEKQTTHSRFRDIAIAIASKLKLTVTADTFRLSISELNSEFSERFDAVCYELREAKKTVCPQLSFQPISKAVAQQRTDSLLERQQ
jgi:hypothetical protein